MLTWLVAAAIGVMLLFPQSPTARALQRLLVERPAGALNRLRRTHWLLGLAIVLVAVAAAAMGRELFLVFAQGTPELIAWIAAFDIATYADAFAAALLVATAVRLKPVLAATVALGVPVSIDSIKGAVVDWALGMGAAIANDVWGLQRDPDMARVVADRGVPVIVMHNRDEVDATVDIMQDIAAFFGRSLEIAAKAGIPSGHIVLDPGIGFGKTQEQSMIALARLEELQAFGLPVLVGASRKRFISTVVPSEPEERLGGSLAAHLIAARGGARIIRTHDVADTVQALRVAHAIETKHNQA